MTLLKKGIFIVIGIIFVLILAQIIESINTDLRATFDSNSVFALTGPLTLILLALLALGFVIGIILNTLRRDEPEPVQFQRRSRFEDFEE